MLKCHAMAETEKVVATEELAKRSEPLLFQERDSEVINSIEEYDGVLARRHIKHLFWPNKGWRALEKRLSKLRSEHYIEWPSNAQRKIFPIPEPIVWLGWKGAMFLSAKQGIDVIPPKSYNENQLRNLEYDLRKKGFTWVREPRWSKLNHDLTVVDVRFWVTDSLKSLPAISLNEWINESSFHSQTDYVEYQIRTREGDILKKRKGVCPDGYFAIVDDRRKEQGEFFTARFLVEVDMATHDNPSFGMDKVLPGIVYLKSDQYKARFGGEGGRWLVITTSPIRINNLIRETQRIAGEDSKFFFFTYFENCRNHNFFTDPIWQQGNGGPPRTLIQM